jgi:hypothetical protein
MYFSTIEVQVVRFKDMRLANQSLAQSNSVADACIQTERVARCLTRESGLGVIVSDIVATCLE